MRRPSTGSIHQLLTVSWKSVPPKVVPGNSMSGSRMVGIATAFAGIRVSSRTLPPEIDEVTSKGGITIGGLSMSISAFTYQNRKPTNASNVTRRGSSLASRPSSSRVGRFSSR